jgi:hypothetical protein
MNTGLVHMDYLRAAKTLRCDVAAVRAVCEVEAPMGGFLPNGQVTILFERHKFSQFTDGRFDDEYPDISNPTAGGYGPAGQHQHDRLARAVALDREAALKSASWGKFQIMGFNHAAAGFPVLQDFINAMHDSESAHLEAFVNFILSQKLDDEMRERRWADFARKYNGPAYRANHYDTKLATAFKKFST